MRLMLWSVASTIPMGLLLFGLIAAMLQPHEQPRHVTRYRLFKTCGATRLRAVLSVALKP
jgi:hypothetical protein